MASIPFVPQDNQLGRYDTPQFAPAQPNQALSKSEDFLETQAQHDAAIEGLNKLTDFRNQATTRLQALQETAKSPDQFTPAAMQDFEGLSQKYLSGVSNPRVAQFLQERLPQVREDYFRQSTSWEQGQRQSLRETQFSTSLNTMANTVASDPSKFGSSMSDVQAALDQGGFDPANKAHLLQVANGTLGRSYISGVTENDPGEALRQLNNGTLDKVLTPEEKLSAISRATAALKFRDAGASQDAVDLANSDIQSRTETGKPLDPSLIARIQAGLTPKEFERYQSRTQKADEVFRATGDMTTLTGNDMVSRVEALRPQGGEADFGDKEAAYAAALTRMRSVLTARRSDPGLAVRNAFPEVEGAWQAYGKAQGPDQATALQAALKASGTAQNALGIPIAEQKLMPDQLAQSIAGQIKGAPPEKAAQILQQTASQFGSYWPQALKQMSRMLDPASKVAATIEDSADGALLLEAARQPQAELMRNTGAVQKDFTNTITADPRVQALSFSLSQRQGGSGTASDISNAIQTLALGRMRAKGEDQATATEAAIKAIVDAKYDFNYTGGRAYRIPKGYDTARIDDGANLARTNLDPKGIDVPQNVPGALHQDTLDSYVSSVRRNGFWVTNDDETGVILYNERGVPVTRGGKPIEQKFQDLQATPVEPLPFNPYQQGGMGGPEYPNAAAANADGTPAGTKAFDEATARAVVAGKLRTNKVSPDGETFLPGIAQPGSELDASPAKRAALEKTYAGVIGQMRSLGFPDSALQNGSAIHDFLADNGVTHDLPKDAATLTTVSPTTRSRWFAAAGDQNAPTGSPDYKPGEVASYNESLSNYREGKGLPIARATQNASAASVGSPLQQYVNEHRSEMPSDPSKIAAQLDRMFPQKPGESSFSGIDQARRVLSRVGDAQSKDLAGKLGDIEKTHQETEQTKALVQRIMDAPNGPKLNELLRQADAKWDNLTALQKMVVVRRHINKLPDEILSTLTDAAKEAMR